MKAEELRKGNLVVYEGRIGAVQWFTNKSFCLKMEFSTLNHKSRKVWTELPFEPIPLSEQWLLDFGYEVNDDLGDQIYYQIPNETHGYGICFDHDDITFYKFYGNGGENVHTLIYDEMHLQYVHHLQNLIFALKGKELSLTNKELK